MLINLLTMITIRGAWQMGNYIKFFVAHHYFIIINVCIKIGQKFSHCAGYETLEICSQTKWPASIKLNRP
jgi:hypothetical protein